MNNGEPRGFADAKPRRPRQLVVAASRGGCSSQASASETTSAAAQAAAVTGTNHFIAAPFEAEQVGDEASGVADNSAIRRSAYSGRDTPIGVFRPFLRCVAYRRVVSLVTNGRSGRPGTPNSGGVCPRRRSRRPVRAATTGAVVGRTCRRAHPGRHSPRPGQSMAGQPGSFLYLVGDEPRFAAFRNSPEGRAEWARLIYQHPLAIERMSHPTETRAIRIIRLRDAATTPRARGLRLRPATVRSEPLRDSALLRSEPGLRSFVRPRQRRLRTPGSLATRGRSNRAWHGRSVAAANSSPTARAPRHYRAGGAGPRSCCARRSNAEIAGELSVAPGTVKKHLDNIFEKLGVRNRVAAARIWIAASSSQSPEDLGLLRSPVDDLVA